MRAMTIAGGAMRAIAAGRGGRRRKLQGRFASAYDAMPVEMGLTITTLTYADIFSWSASRENNEDDAGRRRRLPPRSARRRAAGASARP